MLLVLAVIGLPFAYDGDLAPGKTLSVRDVNGSIRVRTGERLAVRATKTASKGDPNEVAIHVEQRASGIVVCVRYPPDAGAGCDARDSRGSSDNNTRVDFDVTLPHGAALHAATVNGSIGAQTDGAADAETVNGTIHLVARDVRSVRTVNGEIDVRVLDRPTGSLVADSVNGAIDISLPPGTGVALSAHTQTGNIDAPGVDVQRPQYGPGASARGSVGDGSVRVAMHTINGNLTLRR